MPDVKEDRYKEVWDKVCGYQSLIRSVSPLIHMAIMGVDVAQQKRKITEVDDLLIHPLSHVIGDHGRELILRYVSKVLTEAVEKLDPEYEKHYGVNGKSKGSLE